MSALIAAAEEAQDIAAALDKFLRPVSYASSELTGLISECYAISSALRHLDTCRRNPLYTYMYPEVEPDVRVTLQSLEYTFNDVRRLLGGLGNAAFVSQTSAYQTVWDDIISFFRHESGHAFQERLEDYSRFILALSRFVQRIPRDLDEEEDLRFEIRDLFRRQDERLAVDMNNLSLGSLGANRQRSFVRRRPLVAIPPSPPLPPATGRVWGRRPGPASPLSPEFDQGGFWAPEIPISPITTNTSSTTQSSRVNSITSHWVPRLFDQSRPASLLREAGQVSACFGEDMPGASSKLAQEYEKLLELPFENGNLFVRLYLRASDQRARIYCRTHQPNRPQKQSCLPLTSLRVQRNRSSLQLHRMNQSGHLTDVWARLRFESLERLVLFHGTFLALKAEDSVNRTSGTVDDTMKGEVQHFGQLILDDQYEHVLRLFKDKDSGTVRLQASVRDGDLRRTPVWTAFITHHIASRSWIRRARGNPKTVYLAELQRFTFTSEYNPQLGPGGEHELRFQRSEYAAEFMDAVEELARHQS